MRSTLLEGREQIEAVEANPGHGSLPVEAERSLAIVEAAAELPLRAGHEGRDRTLLRNSADETILLRAAEQVVSVHALLHRHPPKPSHRVANRNVPENHDGSVILQRNNHRNLRIFLQMPCCVGQKVGTASSAIIEEQAFMRVIVIGKEGQVARALAERAPAHGAKAVLLGRPGLDLADPSGIEDTLREAGGDLIVNAAAYTAVDQAETESELAEAINGIGAGVAAGAAAAMRVPFIQISTDYVFDGTLDRPYREDDAVNPLGAYGRSKRLGEEAVAAETEDHAILRTAWIYSPFGRNFVKTMLRLAKDREEVGIVADQLGSPTSALDIADGIFAVAKNLLEKPQDRTLRGIFHMAGTGFASWAEFASEIFTLSARYGGPSARVHPLATEDYPTPAKRPANSRLDCTKLETIHGVRLPSWPTSLEPCVERLIAEMRGSGPS